MPALTQSNPKYRKHRASGQAVVTLDGRDHYLGPHGTKTSWTEYDRLIALWLANGRHLPQADSDLTIVEMLAAFRRHAKRHYRRDGQPTATIRNIDDSIRRLKLLFGRERVREFGPLKLQALQAVLSKSLARRTVNDRIGWIKLIFRWAVSQEMAPPSLAHALNTVRGLQRGRTEARETEPVRPVDDATIDATLAHLPTVVADMVRFQRLTGCRPSEVCILRPSDLDRSADVWLYRPSAHKTQHLGRERIIFVGPQAQSVLRPYLLRNSAANCFSPQESERKRLAKMRAARKTPVQPSQQDRRKRKPKLQPTECYNKTTYRRAVVRACEKAGIAAWSPNRLRHTAATKIRQRFGLEAAQVCLGHSRADVTQVYAERDAGLGITVARQIG